jgi:hypothetical protein
MHDVLGGALAELDWDAVVRRVPFSFARAIERPRRGARFDYRPLTNAERAQARRLLTDAGLDPRSLARRDRPTTFVDVVQSGSTRAGPRHARRARAAGAVAAHVGGQAQRRVVGVSVPPARGKTQRPCIEESGGRAVSDEEQQTADYGSKQAFTELLQELRVVQTGVQLLSAFLLTLPFTNRWELTTGGQRAIYAVSVIAAAVCTALVIGPVSYHHTQRERGGDGRLLQTSSRLARGGLIALLLAAVAAVFLALDVGLGRTVAAVAIVPIIAVFVGVWYVLPVFRGGQTRTGSRSGSSSS